MFDDFDMEVSCDEFFENEPYEEWEEREDFPDDHLWDNLDMGFDPYMGCYSWDC